MPTHEAELILSCKANGTAEVKKFNDAVVEADQASEALKQTVAGIFSTAALTKIGVDSVRAWATQEKAVMSLQSALRLQGAAYVTLTDDLMNFNSEMQNQTVYGDEQIAMIQAQGLNMGITADKIKDATKAAIGLAAAYNMQLGTAMMLIARASQGQTQMLTRYGIVLDENLSPQKKFAKLLELGASKMVIASDMAKTMEGSIQQMNNAVGDAKETIGEVFAPTLTTLAHTATSAAQGFQKIPEPIRNVIVMTGTLTAGMTALRTAINLKTIAEQIATGTTLAHSGAIADNSVSLAAETNAHIANTNALRHETAEKIKSALAENKLQVLSAKNAYKKAVAAGEDPSKVSKLRDEYKKLLVTRQDLRQQFNDSVVDKNLGKWGHTVAMTNKQMNIMAKKSFPMLNGATSMLRSGFNGVSVAARSIGVAMKGVLTSMLPMLALSLAIQGVMWLINRRSEQNKAALDIAQKETEQVQKQIDEQKKLRDLDNDKMRRYEELAKLTDRTEEEQKELVRITGELNKGYNGLNAPLLKQNETLEDTAKLWETIKKKQKEQQEQELKALAFVKKQESDSTLLTTYDAFGSSNQHKERLEYISNITNRKEQERQLNEFLALLKRNKNSEAYSAVLAYRMSLRSIDSIRNQYRDLVSGKTEEKNANAENRKLAKERRKLSDKYNEKLKRDQYDQLELQKKIASKEDDLAEYRKQERHYAQRDKTSENVKKLYEFKTKILETEKELKNLHAQSAEAMKQENDEIMRQAKELEDKKLQKARKVYDALQQQKQAQVSIWQELYNAGRSYRETAQSAVMTNSEQAIRMQSRFLFAPKLNTAEMAQKQTAATATEIRKILDEWKQKSDSLNTEVQTIARNLQVTDYQ